MDKNMSNLDRYVRVALAIVIGILYFTGQITGTAAIVLGILAIIFILTSTAGVCLVYRVLNISTKKNG